MSLDDCLEKIATSYASLEESLKPFDVNSWCAYEDDLDMQLSSDLDYKVRDLVGRRALKYLPRSYKLWKRQIEFLLQWEKKKSDDEEVTNLLQSAFTRALLTMHGFPRIWILYLDWLITHPMLLSPTQVRRLCNRCVQALPITQHDKVWDSIRRLARETLPIESQLALERRYVMFSRDDTAFAEILLQHERWAEAALCYQRLLDKGQTDDLWASFLNVCSQHPREVQAAGIVWQDMVRTKCEQLEQEESSSSVLLGWLWSQLADAWIRLGEFDLARSVYEEGLQRITKVRDFTILYNAYLQLEESLLEAATNSLEEGDDVDMQEEEQEVDSNDFDILLRSETSSSSKLADMEWAMARAEHLTQRRPILLNLVMLRQNPHDVSEWLQRAKLLERQNAGQAAQALEDALCTVVSNRAANGNPSQLVLHLSKIYQTMSIDKARDLFDRICNQHVYRFAKADDLAECWTAWIELELQQEAWDAALSLARQSVASGSGGKLNLTRSLRLWDLLLDLEESLGTVQTTKDAYNRALEIKAANVQHILNFCSFLSEQKYFEESFTAFERGIELFPFPHEGAKVLWKAYLKAFLDRYEGTKLERTRDLFQRCLESCPAECCADFYLMNGEYEEEYGLTKRALSVYQSMCERVPKDEKLTAYKLFIAKTTKYLGVTATRDIYQTAVEKLDDLSAPVLCVDFAKMETSLQEIERARAVLTYGAQMADPRRYPEYWKEWNDFEISNGNEETFREMLRVKRSVEAAFSTVNYNAAGMTEQVGNLTNEEAMAMIASQEGVDLDEIPQNRAQVTGGFVRETKRNAAAANLDDVEERVAKLRKATGATEEAPAADDDQDDDEIDIDDIDAEIEEAAAEGAVPALKDVSTKAVPDAVFGGLAKGSDNDDGGKGALERLRAATKG